VTDQSNNMANAVRAITDCGNPLAKVI